MYRVFCLSILQWLFHMTLLTRVLNFFLLTSILTGCASEEIIPSNCTGACTTLTGRLTTANNQQGIGGATVLVKWIYGSAYQAKAKTKAKTATDAAGNYQISFFIEDAELADGFFEVFYLVDKSNYYTIGEDGVAFYHLTRDTIVRVANYVIPRKAYVRLSITNQPQLIADKGQYLSTFNTCYGLNNVFSRAIQGGGAAINWDGLPSENPLAVAGDQPVLVKSYKTKNGVLKFSTDSLFIPAGTTQTYTVTY
jgi:hypothetical protein